MGKPEGAKTMSLRLQRVRELLKEEVSHILMREMKDPRLGFVTVTDVDVSADLRHARVYVSVLGSKEEREATMEVLEHAAGFVRRTLGERIRLRYIPELVFVYDETAEKAARIEQLLASIRERRAAAPSAETAEGEETEEGTED
jgi:ribosome-binding factor A